MSDVFSPPASKFVRRESTNLFAKYLVKGLYRLAAVAGLPDVFSVLVGAEAAGKPK